MRIHPATTADRTGLHALALVAWLSASGFTPVADPGELWPVMGRWTEPGR